MKRFQKKKLPAQALVIDKQPQKSVPIDIPQPENKKINIINDYF